MGSNFGDTFSESSTLLYSCDMEWNSLGKLLKVVKVTATEAVRDEFQWACRMSCVEATAI
eukprot:4069413-Amphidinium_carterae.4